MPGSDGYRFQSLVTLADRRKNVKLNGGLQGFALLEGSSCFKNKLRGSWCANEAGFQTRHDPREICGYFVVYFTTEKTGKNLVVRRG